MRPLPVLIYHKIHPDITDNHTVPVDDFRKQLMILKEKGYVSVSCKQLYDSLMSIRLLADKYVLITFDEGHVSCYKYAKPVLEELGFGAVFFVFGDWVLGGSLKENENFRDCMNTDQLRELAQKGFEIGIHGYSGTRFDQLELKDIEIEISKSMTLFRKLELPFVNVLAYPFGVKPNGIWTRSKMYRMLKQQKIMLAFNKRNRMNDLGDVNRLDINRIEINGKDSEKHFMTKLNLRGRKWF